MIPMCWKCISRIQLLDPKTGSFKIIGCHELGLILMLNVFAK